MTVLFLRLALTLPFKFRKNASLQMRQKLVLFCQLVLPVVIVLAMGVFQLVVRAANKRDASKYFHTLFASFYVVSVDAAVAPEDAVSGE